jgi:hypothetical protein
MKRTLFILMIFSWTLTESQNDSIKRRRYQIQADFSNDINFSNPNFNQHHFQKYAGNDPFLKKDLTGYTPDYYSLMYQVMPGMFGLRLVRDLPGKGFNKEISIGLKYDQEILTWVNYTKNTYDTIAVFQSSQTSYNVYQVQYYQSQYEFSISANRLFLPISFCFTGNKNNIIWMAAGVELTPFIYFNPELRSINMEDSYDFMMREGDSLKYYWSHYNVHRSSGPLFNHNAQSIKGSGGGFYLAFPLNFYFHPFRKALLFNRAHIFAGVYPLFAYAHSSFTGASTKLNLGLNTGLRINL